MIEFDFSVIIPFLPVLFFLARISHNTGKMAQKVDGHEKRLDHIEKKIFFVKK
tara:strand:+ start:29907 stop:30065 length:159 start_codon:yes stop_codon:yes gene_type:complete